MHVFFTLEDVFFLAGGPEVENALGFFEGGGHWSKLKRRKFLISHRRHNTRILVDLRLNSLTNLPIAHQTRVHHYHGARLDVVDIFALVELGVHFWAAEDEVDAEFLFGFEGAGGGDFAVEGAVPLDGGAGFGVVDVAVFVFERLLTIITIKLLLIQRLHTLLIHLLPIKGHLALGTVPVLLILVQE